MSTSDNPKRLAERYTEAYTRCVGGSPAAAWIRGGCIWDSSGSSDPDDHDELLIDGQEEAFSRAGVEPGRIEHHAVAGGAHARGTVPDDAAPTRGRRRDVTSR